MSIDLTQSASKYLGSFALLFIILISITFNCICSNFFLVYKAAHCGSLVDTSAISLINVIGICISIRAFWFSMVTPFELKVFSYVRSSAAVIQKNLLNSETPVFRWYPVALIALWDL